MLRSVKKLACLGLVALGLQSAMGFALLGPKEAWQTESLGYLRLTEMLYPFGTWTTDSGPAWDYAPKNYNEWYRWSVPTLYYTYDPSFSTYFKTRGMEEVDAAFAVMNSITNVDLYSKDLSEFPLDEFRQNYTAAAMHLFDLKSATLEMLVTRMGLADPERWTWCLRNRILRPGEACPNFDFDVIQRNFDPLTLGPSKYVNGILYTYQWLQFCGVFSDRSDPVEYLPDPTHAYMTAVASSKILTVSSTYYGHFHTGLTRDDVGGLRYLYSTNTLASEMTPSDTLWYRTNAVAQILYTSNLTLLASQALTNDPVTLGLLYPGLSIIGGTNYFTNIFTTNATAYFTNYPWDPVGSAAHLAYTTNITVAVGVAYEHVFGNLLTVAYTPNGWATVPITTLPAPSGAWVTVETTSVGVSNVPWAPAGTVTIRTNTSAVTYRTNAVMGEFILLPTNSCSVQLLYAQLTNVLTYTNLFLTATNTQVATNSTGGTNAGTLLSYTQNFITYSTNHAFAIYPVTCETNSVAKRQGLGRIQFVRHDFENMDPLTGLYTPPITNYFDRVAIVGNQRVMQRFQRIVTRPDIIIASQDLQATTPQTELIDTSLIGAPAFNTNASNPLLVGPGTLEGPMRLTFNQVGPLHLNSGGFFVDEASSIFFFTWSSFNGSTNAPFVYGDTTLDEMQNYLVISVSPTFLPAATEDSFFYADLQVTGGAKPYTWSVAPSSTGLPPGIGLSQNASDSSKATLSGTAPGAGDYRFMIRLTDAGGRYVDVNYVLQVSPR
jgi:hypothetical protein